MNIYFWGTQHIRKGTGMRVIAGSWKSGLNWKQCDDGEWILQVEMMVLSVNLRIPLFTVCVCILTQAVLPRSYIQEVPTSNLGREISCTEWCKIWGSHGADYGTWRHVVWWIYIPKDSIHCPGWCFYDFLQAVHGNASIALLYDYNPYICSMHQVVLKFPVPPSVSPLIWFG
jgi:hypothetical protein